MNTPPVNPFPQYRVYQRQYVETGAWTPVEHVQLKQMTLCAAPELPTARLSFRSGQVIQPGETDYADYSPLDLGGKFLKIELLEDDGATLRSTHCFQVLLDERRIGGKPGVGIPQPQWQEITAVGLEELLDRSPINGGYMYDSGATPADIGYPVHTPLAFNERYRRGYNKTGNRSNTVVATGNGLPEPDTKGFTVFGAARNALYAFDAITQSAVEPARWSIDDILGYLYGFWVRSIDLKFVWHEASPPAHAAALRTALQGIFPPAFSVEGRTVKQALDALLNAEKGLGWCFRYPAIADGDPIVPIVDIFPVANTTIVLDGVTIPANARTASVNTTTNNLIGDVVVGRDHSLEFGALIVLGEPVLSCFTLSKADATLDKGWTDAEAAAFLATVNLPDDKQPDHDLYRNVYQKFIVPMNWNQKVKNGVGGAESTQPVNPRIDGDGAPSTTEAAPLMRRGHGFESTLPIPRPQQDTSTPEIEYLEAFALMRVAWNQPPGTFRWNLGEKMFTKHLRPDVRMTAVKNELAVFLSAGDQRELSGGPKQYNWETDMMVTVAMRTDQRLYVYKSLPGPVERRLVIEVRDAELWLVHPNTVVGVSDVGVLQYYTGALKARDDAGRLKEIAETMAAWYGVPRGSWQFTYQAEWPATVLGTYVSLTAVDGEAPIGNILTRIDMDFINGQMTFAGQYRPLNPIF